MRFTLLCLVFCLCLTWPTARAAGQQDPPKPQQAQPAGAPERQDKKSAGKEETALRQRGIDLIRQAGEEADSLDDHSSAARIQGAAGAALWGQDKESARKFFRKAVETAMTYEHESKRVSSNPSVSKTAVAQPDLCQEIIRLVNHYDPDLGRELAEKYNDEKQRRQKENGKQSGAGTPSEAYLYGSQGKGEQTALQKSFESLFSHNFPNSDTAVAEAQRVFSTGLSPNALVFIWRLANTDRSAADRLFLWILDRTLENETAGAGQLLVIAPYPFGEHFIWVTDGMGARGAALDYYGFLGASNRVNPPALLRDELLILRFLDVSFTVLTRVAESDLSGFPDATSRLGAAIFLARWLESRVEQSQPGLLPQWRALVASLSSRLSAEHQRSIDQEFDYLSKGRERYASADAGQKAGATDLGQTLLDLAGKTSDFAQRDYLYQEAALEFDRQGDRERAFETASRISSLDHRQQVQDWFYFNAATRALSEEKLDDARRLALEVRAKEQQAYLLCQIARVASKRRDHSLVTQLLSEAETQAGAAANTAGKVCALLSLAQVYAGFDPPHALETMAEVTRTINRIPTYEPGQTKLVRALRGPSGLPRKPVEGAESPDLASTFTLLARSDFDSVLPLAQSLENKPLKLTAVIAVAASVLNKKPETPAPPKTAKN